MVDKNQCITVLPELTAATPEEFLAKNFYDWEQRGRGWHLWVHTPELEPPFRPFFHWISPHVFRAKDDGHIPSFGQRLFEKLERLVGSGNEHTSETEMECLKIIEPEAECFANDRELIEIELTLPPALKINKEVVTQFIVSLNYCSKPLAFEIIGTAESISVQLVCRDTDLYPVREQLSAYFPEAVLTERHHHLLNLWSACDSNMVLVDMGLSREFMLPLKTFSVFEVDPISTFIGALAELEPGEIGVLQIMFQPAQHPWAASILRAVTDGEGKPFFCDAPEVTAQARQKVAHPLYATVIRVAARSSQLGGAWNIVRALGAGLAQYSSPTANSLIPLENEAYPDDIHEEDLLSRQSHRTGMLLNSEELISLVHPPSASVRSPKLRREVRKTKAAPALAIGQRLILGENSHNGKTTQVTLSPAQRIRHMHVIGASGTGKSTFLLNMILQDIENGEGLAVLDPHGDLIDQIIERIPESRWGDVVLIDPSDSEYPVGFNILSAHSELEKHLLASDLVSVFRRLSTSWGDQMSSVLGNAILAFLESEHGGTLADLRRFLVEKEYRARFLCSVKDQEVVYYWQKEFPFLSGKPQGPLLTRLDIFLRPKPIRYMVAQKENKLDFARIMNEGKIVLAKLAQGAIGEENAYLLGTLLVSKFHQLTLSRQEMQESGRRDFFLYIDEFHNFVTPSMASILSGARKYHLGLVLAHQEMRQIGRDNEVAGAVLANPFTRVCFRLGDEDARKLADGFSFFEPKDLQNLGTGEAICRLERAEYDFNLKTSALDPVDLDIAEQNRVKVVELSRRKYATNRELVEAELASDWHTTSTTQPARKPENVSMPLANPVEPAFKPESIQEHNECKPVALQQSSITPPPLPQTQLKPKPVPVAPLVSHTPGRGGKEHKYLQQLIKQWAEGMGWRAEIEKEILNGAGSVDVALTKGPISIACEISVTTGVEQELGNIEKCIKAGFTHVVALSTDRKQIEKIKTSFSKSKGRSAANVHFMNTDELFEFVETIDSTSASHETNVRGYKVKVSYRKVEDEEKKDKRQTLGRVVADSLNNSHEQKNK